MRHQHGAMYEATMSRGRALSLSRLDVTKLQDFCSSNIQRPGILKQAQTVAKQPRDIRMNENFILFLSPLFGFRFHE